jgi:hypothetical protein
MNVPGLFFMKLSQMVARNTKKKCGGSALFLVILSAMPNQRKKRLLNHVRGRFRASTHTHRVPVESTLVATIELQKSFIVSRCQAPQKVNITRFDCSCHLPRLDVSLAVPP